MRTGLQADLTESRSFRDGFKSSDPKGSITYSAGSDQVIVDGSDEHCLRTSYQQGYSAMKKLQLLLLLQGIILIAAQLSGCASSSSAVSFSQASARTAFTVYYGEVLGTRIVELEGEPSVVGFLGGALIGHAIGVGNSDYYWGERRIQASIGAVGGSIAGEAIERAARRSDGLEVVVLLDHNETIAVVQDTDLAFADGDRVQVLIGDDGSTRVQPL